MAPIITGDEQTTERRFATKRSDHFLAAGAKEEMATLLAELVAIPTENPPGKNYAACTELLERRLGELDLNCERWAPADAKQGDWRCSGQSFG